MATYYQFDQIVPTDQQDALYTADHSVEMNIASTVPVAYCAGTKSVRVRVLTPDGRVMTNYQNPTALVILAETTAGDGDVSAAAFPIVNGEGICEVAFTGTWAADDTCVMIASFGMKGGSFGAIDGFTVVA